MRRGRIAMLLVLAALAAGILLCWPREPKEPAFEGRRLGYWIRAALASVGSREEEQAERAVKAVGTNALPYLLHQFTKPRSRWQSLFNQGAVKLDLPLRDAFETEDERISAAVMGLTCLGPDAAAALPALASQLGDQRRGVCAALLMGGCGDKALPFLRTALGSTNPVIVSAAMEGLRTLGQESEAALQLQQELLGHANGDVRISAIIALRSTSLHPDRTIPGLVQAALSDPDKQVQEAAVASFNELKPVSSAAAGRNLLSAAGASVPALRQALSKSDSRLRSNAAFILGKLGTVSKPAVPDLLRLLNEPDAYCAMIASNALARIDPSALTSPPPQQ